MRASESRESPSNHAGCMPWYAPRKVRICVQPLIAGMASSCLRYASSSTIREAISSGSGGASPALLLLSPLESHIPLGGSLGRLLNIELSAAWLLQKCEYRRATCHSSGTADPALGRETWMMYLVTTH